MNLDHMNSRTNIFQLGLFLMLTTLSFAQGKIEIIKDPRIDALIRKQGETTSPTGVVTIPGYRVQIFFDASKTKVDDMRNSFSRTHPKIEAYVTYNAPNYFLRVGDFRTNAEAERFKQEISSKYPSSFVVKERVFLPRID